MYRCVNMKAWCGKFFIITFLINCSVRKFKRKKLLPWQNGKRKLSNNNDNRLFKQFHTLFHVS